MADFESMDYAEVVEHLKDVNDQATDLLAELVKAVRATGRKGSVTVVMHVEERNKTTHELGVSAEVKSSPPNRKTIYSLYSDAKGQVGTEPEQHLFTGQDAEREDAEGSTFDPGF